MCIYMLLSLCTKLYMITCVNVEDRGSAEGYDDEFREDGGDDAFRENEGYAFGENEGGDVEYVVRDQEQGHANARRKRQGQRRDTFEQAHGCHPMTIYPSDIPASPRVSFLDV